MKALLAPKIHELRVFVAEKAFREENYSLFKCTEL